MYKYVRKVFPVQLIPNEASRVEWGNGPVTSQSSMFALPDPVKMLSLAVLFLPGVYCLVENFFSLSSEGRRIMWACGVFLSLSLSLSSNQSAAKAVSERE